MLTLVLIQIHVQQHIRLAYYLCCALLHLQDVFGLVPGRGP
jgi:hypothetical protein